MFVAWGLVGLNQNTIEKEFQAKFNNIRSNFEKEIAFLKRAAGEFEGKLSILHRENENLEEMLQEKSKELQSWITKYHSMEVELTSQYENAVYRFEEYKRAYSSLDLETKFKAERASYESQIIQLRQRVTEFEELNKVLAADAKKLAKANSDKFRELDGLRAELARVENEHYKETYESRVQMDHFKRSSLDVQEITTRHSAEASKLQSQIQQLEQNNSNLKEELSKVYDLLERRKLEDSRNVRTIEELRLQIASYNSGEARDPAIQSDYIRELQEQLLQSDDERKRIEEMYQRNAFELAAKNDELIGKLRELDSLKRQYEASMYDLGNVTASVATSQFLRRKNDF